eukprot:GCRY01000375.1.p1 GENE.GCRY01000375.1~~GCRY01000375.1.p1  ORF type:complete len:138 (-),score=33.36 GCRY01000375.1:139-552(-)
MEEDNYQEEVSAGPSDEQLLSQVQERESTVRNMLNKGQVVDALPTALQDPPIQTKKNDIKDKNFQVVMSVLTATKETDISKAVEKLDTDQIDVLMKYIYKGLAACVDSAKLLKWHEATFEKGGHGAIVRSMVERKTV